MASRPRKGSEARQQPKRILVPAVSKNARFIEFDAARLKVSLQPLQACPIPHPGPLSPPSASSCPAQMDRALQSTDCLIAFMRTRAEMEAKLHKDLAELAARGTWPACAASRAQRLRPLASTHSTPPHRPPRVGDPRCRCRHLRRSAGRCRQRSCPARSHGREHAGGHRGAPRAVEADPHAHAPGSPGRPEPAQCACLGV